MDDIFVGRLMSSPVETVTPDTLVREAAQNLLDEGIGSAIVVDEDNHLQGILTATDFVRIVAQKDPESESVVADFMSTDVVTVTVNTPIAEAADIMLENGFHHLPVVDDEEGVVGIVTTTDLTAYVSTVQTPSPA